MENVQFKDFDSRSQFVRGIRVISTELIWTWCSGYIGRCKVSFEMLLVFDLRGGLR